MHGTMKIAMQQNFHEAFQSVNQGDFVACEIDKTHLKNCDDLISGVVVRVCLFLSCKLQAPHFHGQSVWIENSVWAEMERNCVPSKSCKKSSDLKLSRVFRKRTINVTKYRSIYAQDLLI